MERTWCAMWYRVVKGYDGQKVLENVRNVKNLLCRDLHNVFIGWSKVSWPMVFYSALYLSMLFWPILIFRVFWFFLERVGINHNKFSASLHLWGRNNNALDHIWWKFSFEGENGGNNGGDMMYEYGLYHGELAEHCFVLTKLYMDKKVSCQYIVVEW